MNGLCECGCGQPAPIAKQTESRYGYVKGQSMCFIKGHHLFRPVADRLWEKVDRDGPVPAARPDLGPCWLWRGAANDLGYGQIAIARRKTPAHRVAYELVVGPIGDGLDLDHLCRVPACVNPAHLEPVTHQENMRRGAAATKTHCPHGHSLEDALITKAGHRRCRTCDRRRSREYHARTKGE